MATHINDNDENALGQHLDTGMQSGLFAIVQAHKPEAFHESSCGCCSQTEAPSARRERWIIGEQATAIGNVPTVTVHLDKYDRWGACKVRFGIGRMHYKINPGLYAIGEPDRESPVLVTANYKLSFDSLRKELSGLHVWLMVLDTNGINVWCAAGKGTFGTEELLKRIATVRLDEIVTHKTLILPQLGAPGVKAHEITKRSGFKVIYGPVRASDIKKFLESGMKATAESREVRFTFVDRLVLTPVEFVSTLKIATMVFGVMFLINLFAAHPFGAVECYAFTGALIVGTVITPILLPWIPGRAFAVKGLLLGLLWAAVVIGLNSALTASVHGMIKMVAFILTLPAVSAYYAMNFTGSSTYTSLSGVMKEMRIAIPVIAVAISIGTVLMLISSVVS